MRWHKSREIFESECVGFPGFVTKFRVATNDTPEDAKNSKDHVDYENYRHVVHKWHFKIAKALVVCLESKDYVQIRNALTILTKILPHFPVIAKLNGVIEKRIGKGNLVQNFTTRWRSLKQLNQLIFVNKQLKNVNKQLTQIG